MQMILILEDKANPSSLMRRIRMLDGVKDAVEVEDTIAPTNNHDADLAVWLDHGGNAGDVEDLLHGTKGVKKVSILK